MVKFTGRESELKKLTQLSQRKSASFIVIRGRSYFFLPPYPPEFNLVERHGCILRAIL